MSQITRQHFTIAFIVWILAAPSAFAQSKPADFGSAVETTARQVSPAVVQIFTTSYIPAQGMVPSTSDLVATQRASGSGAIVDSEGYIVTNAHVVRGARRVRVEVPVPAKGQSILAAGSRSFNAEIVGWDLETDLAVLKINERNLPVLAFMDSDELRAGQVVLAFGSPLGLHNSVTLGIVSSVARQLEPESPMIYIQTDASINPGSSGGPLVDLKGRIVGINTMILSQAGGDEGLGFAAPGNIVKAVYQQIKTTGHVRRGDIGLRVQTVTPAMAAGLGLERDHGVVVADVAPGSASERVGIKRGDLILAVDGKAMENGRQLQVNLYRRLIGDVVTLEVLRESRTMEVPVAMTERRDLFGESFASSDPRENLIPRLAILAVTLTRPMAEVLPVLRVRSGVVVTSTVDGAIDTREGGLAAGDVIFAVNRKNVASIEELRKMLADFNTGDPVVLQLERRGELLYLAFTAD